MWHDIRYAIRLLGRNPGFAAAAILTVAIGIAATTGMFSVLYSVSFQPLPFGDPDRLVRIRTNVEKLNLESPLMGAADYRDLRERNSVFEDIALVRNIANMNLTGEGEPERLQGARVSPNLFAVLRVQPALGRVFQTGED